MAALIEKARRARLGCLPDWRRAAEPPKQSSPPLLLQGRAWPRIADGAASWALMPSCGPGLQSAQVPNKADALPALFRAAAVQRAAFSHGKSTAELEALPAGDERRDFLDDTTAVIVFNEE